MNAPADPTPPGGYKSRGGVGRLWNALRYSRRGLAAALRHEAAFRQEVLLCVLLVPLAFWLPLAAGQRLALLGTLLLVLIVELLNSAIEAVADRLSPEHDPLIGRAKDLGSAAVLVALVLAAATWVTLAGPSLYERLAR